MSNTNQQVAKLLRDIAAAYTIKKQGNIFQIRAYQNAADSIEHSTAEIKDLWEEKKLDQVPTLGQKTREYLDELFRTGRVAHFEEVKRDIPDVVFELLEIPGIGPKIAYNLSELGVKSIEDLKKQVKTGELMQKGFSGKIAQKLMDGIRDLSNKSGRMQLPYAFAQADKILAYLRKSSDVKEVDSLGSLRRMVVTVGDLDFAASSHNPAKVIDYFCKMPGVVRILDQGENKANVILHSGIQADLLVGSPDSYGALLQHFTGSKNHNIHLRTLAEKKGLSLSEYGVAKVRGEESKGKGNEVITCKTEEEFYKLLGMQTPPPEIREDTGEIEAASQQSLPKLIELSDVKGDLHTHSNFSLEPSHGPGANSIEEIIKQAQKLDYEFIGISDHSPAFTTHSKEQILSLIQKRTIYISNLVKSTKSIRILNGLEIDILGDGSLSVPDEALTGLDYCIAGIHSGHRGTKEQITKRILSALANPHVDIISHPTNRLINERPSSDADWPEIFKYCAKYNKLLEINAFPNRLDLRDDLVREALKYGVKFVIDTDAHEISQMENMLFGVSVARRGWATKKDIVNTWSWTDVQKWFKIK